MIVIFDTNILIDIDHGRSDVIESVSALVEELPATEYAITWVTFYEFYYGAYPNDAVVKRSLEFLNKFSFLAMDKEATKVFTYLKKEKTDVKDFDLLIAAITIANNAILITRDTDFKRIKNLQVKIL